MRYKQPGHTARVLLKSPVLRNATLKEVQNVVRRECNSICQMLPKPSLLRTGSSFNFANFSWSSLLQELSSKAPTLLAVLMAASGCDHATSKSTLPVGMAASVVLFSRSQHLCNVQTMIGGILYAGHAAKKVCYL